ncbi:hypothetical protein B0H11DRAFT_472037 [Mycena galericulata]|nr:hypothetical protein B0H11DRAFT_472037 [Mycena galericulata]
MYTSPRPPIASPASRYTSPAFSSHYSSPAVASRYTSPNTPSTPSSYAPATPDNFRMKRLSFSPQVLKADSWRSRASQNGIRVEEDEEEQEPDSDASFEAPLLPPFVTGPRRRALSYASENIPHTPPRNPHLAAQMRLKGSVTAPAHERRAFGLKSNLPDVDERVEPRQEHVDERVESKSHCSSCAVASKQLALLNPCTHALCPACLTSALNIVDQLSMHCVVCRATVDTFGLVRAPPSPTLDESFLLPFSPPSSPSSDEDPVVLRIDNVPWDITPPAILKFLGVSTASGARAHVLLDRLGKTLSHAFVELPSEASARSVLRGEHRAAPVLGSGRRARAVTLTRSSQPALMAALFPSWAGAFDGPAPSLAGLAGHSLPGALEGGLMRESELTDLLWLMRAASNPESDAARFVKVPALPFYALVSILAKFPTDRDSRVFWSAGLRDLLYDVTFAAIQVLRMRKPEEADPALVKEIVRTALGCHAFTEQQLRGLSEFDTMSSRHSDVDDNETGDEEDFHARYQCQTYAPPPSPHGAYEDLTPPTPPAAEPTTTALAPDAEEEPVPDAAARMSDLAREFGVERELVEALVLRLGISGGGAA